MPTVKEVIEEYTGRYDEFEVWAYSDRTHRLHTDFINNIDASYSLSEYENKKVAGSYLMDEDEYNRTICANAGYADDFEMLYDKKEAKVLVIMLNEDWNKEPEESEPITENKKRMAKLIISLPGYDGEKDVIYLCQKNTEEQLLDILDAYDVEFNSTEYDNTKLSLTETQHKLIESARKSTKAQIAASAKYDKNNTKKISLKLNLITDADILEKLKEEKNMQGYIKKLIRNDILK